MYEERTKAVYTCVNDMESVYFQEKYSYYIKGRKKVFDKQYIFYSPMYLTRNEYIFICICTDTCIFSLIVIFVRAWRHVKKKSSLRIKATFSFDAIHTSMSRKPAAKWACGSVLCTVCPRI